MYYPLENPIKKKLPVKNPVRILQKISHILCKNKKEFKFDNI